jgi:hypothetical protein
MRTDTYTKAVLTVIAIFLAAIACKQYFGSDAAVSAQGPFAGVQFTGQYFVSFFDSRTGEIWNYNSFGQLDYKFRLTKLGQPLVKEK